MPAPTPSSDGACTWRDSCLSIRAGGRSSSRSLNSRTICFASAWSILGGLSFLSGSRSSTGFVTIRGAGRFTSLPARRTGAPVTAPSRFSSLLDPRALFNAIDTLAGPPRLPRRAAAPASRRVAVVSAVGIVLRAVKLPSLAADGAFCGVPLRALLPPWGLSASTLSPSAWSAELLPFTVDAVRGIVSGVALFGSRADRSPSEGRGPLNGFSRFARFLGSRGTPVERGGRRGEYAPA